MASTTKFLISFAATTIVLAMMMTGLLVSNSELYTTRSGVRAQLETNGIYGRSIWDDFFAYKFSLYQMRPAKVVSVGSSRAMPVRALLFRQRDHLSFGGAVNSISELEGFVKQLSMLVHRPDIIYLYVDFEWFTVTGGRDRDKTDRVPYDNWLFVYQSAFAHVRDLAESAFAKKYSVDPVAGGKLIGSRAKRFGDGFRVDGSNQQYSFENGLRPWPDGDIAFVIGSPTAAASKEDARKFVIQRNWWRASFSESNLDRFQRTLKTLQLSGASIILICPPVTPNVAIALDEREELGFFRIWRSRLEAVARDLKVPLFDFTHLPLSSATCYSDRYHASEGAYAWMLSRVRGRLAAIGHPAAETLDDVALKHYSQSDCLRSLG